MQKKHPITLGLILPLACLAFAGTATAGPLTVDIQSDLPWTPYVGGTGMANEIPSAPTIAQPETGYQLAAGVHRKIARTGDKPPAELSLGYRFTGTAEQYGALSPSAGASGAAESHQVKVDLKLPF